jgi:hypothetical protein
MDKENHQKSDENRHHEQSPPTRISLPVSNFQINSAIVMGSDGITAHGNWISWLLLTFSCRDTPFFADTWEKCHGDAFQADCCVKMLFLSQFFYSTVTSRSWLTCWKWTAMMTLRFRQQNRVDGDGSWWRFLWPFLWFWFVHSTGILRRIGTKHEISVRKSRDNPLGHSAFLASWYTSHGHSLSFTFWPSAKFSQTNPADERWRARQNDPKWPNF